VILWPDHDEPGREAMAALAARLPGSRVVTVPPDMPIGWDAADASPDVIAPLLAAAGAAPYADDDPPGTLPGVPGLPDAFWTSRPVLAHIRAAAWSRQRCPDAVLGAVLARVAALVPHDLGLPAIVGAEAGLGLLVALIAPPGTGKSTAVAIGAELLPEGPGAGLVTLPVGSGEGLAEAMYETRHVTVEGKRQTERTLAHRNVLQVIDEGHKALTIGARQGSTLFATWRSVFSGQPLGEANASAERTRTVPAGGYSVGIVALFQPDVLGPLFADLATGTPQRFLYLWATSPEIPARQDAPPWPGALEFEVDTQRAARELFATRQYHARVHVAVRAAIEADDLARARGITSQDDWTGHRNLVRLKVAAFLGLLDGRPEVMPDDWRLAGMVLDVSDAVRRAATDVQTRRSEVRERDTSDRYARRALVVDRALTAERVRRIAVRIHALVTAEPDGIARASLRRRIADRDRELFDEAIAWAITARWIEARVVTGQGRPGTVYQPGPETPR
jgi:hypothetical protein